jgi:hypothetical protein
MQDVLKQGGCDQLNIKTWDGGNKKQNIGGKNRYLEGREDKGRYYNGLGLCGLCLGV